MDNSQKRSHRGLALLVAVAAVFTVGSGSASASAPIPGSFRGESYGTFANVTAGQISSQLGRSAYLPCPCQGTDNELRTETVNSVKAGQSPAFDVFQADVVYTTVIAGKSATSHTATHRQTAEVTGVSALSGAITADAVKAVARTNATTTTITSNTTGSRFVNLRVNGVLQPINVTANTRINIAGFGFVRLNEVTRTGNGTSSGGISVNMIRIVINTENALDIPVGTEIIVAHARTFFNRVNTSVAVGGGAWSADATSTLPLIVDSIGRIAAVYVPCQGTNGVTLMNNVNVTNFPGVITAGSAVSNAFGSVSATQALAKTSARIEQLNLLNGLVRAEVIKASAQATFNDSTNTGTTTGSSEFVNLFIGNQAVVAQPNTVPPNTRVELIQNGVLDIGHVILNEQNRSVTGSSAKITVVAVHVVIDVSTTNLPAGTDIRIAVARAFAFGS